MSTGNMIEAKESDGALEKIVWFKWTGFNDRQYIKELVIEGMQVRHSWPQIFSLSNMRAVQLNGVLSFALCVEPCNHHWLIILIKLSAHTAQFLWARLQTAEIRAFPNHGHLKPAVCLRGFFLKLDYSLCFAKTSKVQHVLWDYLEVNISEDLYTRFTCCREASIV